VTPHNAPKKALHDFNVTNAALRRRLGSFDEAQQFVVIAQVGLLVFLLVPARPGDCSTQRSQPAAPDRQDGLAEKPGADLAARRDQNAPSPDLQPD